MDGKEYHKKICAKGGSATAKNLREKLGEEAYRKLMQKKGKLGGRPKKKPVDN